MVSHPQSEDITSPEELRNALACLRAEVAVQDRDYKGKTYPSCFVGSEAVDVLASERPRHQAIKVGGRLLDEGHFKHVLKEHGFKDQYLFYRFKEDEGKVHGESGKQENGEVLGWASTVLGLLGSNGSPSCLQSSSYTHLPDSRTTASAAEHVAPLPLDEHNLKLLDNVRPASWIEPKPTTRYNLVVVGGGTGGLVAAAGSAGVGAKVAIVEEWMLGGDCLNVGCVPSKAIIRCAHSIHEVRTASEFGVLGLNKDSIKADFPAIMRRMRSLRAEISENDSAKRFASELGVDVFQGKAKFTGRNTLEVNGKTLQFSAAVIATGATPAVPDVKGLKVCSLIHF